MNRRQFLRYSAFGGLSVSLGSLSPFAQSFSASKNDRAPLKGLQMIDAHTHPDRYVYNSRPTDNTSTLKAIKKLGMVASCFAAVGDSVFLSQGRMPGTEYHSTKTQLEWWFKGMVKSGERALTMLEPKGQMPIYHAWASQKWITDVIDIGIKEKDWTEYAVAIRNQVRRQGFFTWRTQSFKRNFREGRWYVSVLDANKRPVRKSGSGTEAFRPEIMIKFVSNVP